jgi:hypothetical protein
MIIIKATYGGIDCTEQVKRLLTNERLIVKSCNDIIGDPAVNTVKHLVVEYEHGGQHLQASAVEGSYISIPSTKHSRLGIFYTNNNNDLTSPTITESLATIKKAAEGKADILTSVWQRIHDNPFQQFEAWTKTSSHLNQLLQIMQLLYIARSTGKYEYVSFLEHDVLYPEGYFNYSEFEKGQILTNMNFGGLCKNGWQGRKQNDEPFHQMTMRFEDAIKHCEAIIPNAIQHNAGLIEPQYMMRKQWKCENEAIHVNHGMHFTSHNTIYDTVNTYHDHNYWGSYSKYIHLFQ